MIRFDTQRCIGCGLCVRDCFPGAISMVEGKPALSAPGNCLACGHCIAVCPGGCVSDDALNMEESFPVCTSSDPTSLLRLMQSRRSCRHYTAEPVTEAELNSLLEAARACPTAKNLQATRYIVVTEKIGALLDAALEGLGKVGIAQKATATAPDELRRAENFIRWAALRKEDKTFDPLFFHAPMLLMFVSDGALARDAAAAASYTELMAASMGLGCLYSGYFTACAAGSPEIQSMLGLKSGEQVVRCLVLGHKDVRFFRTAPRRPLNITNL